MEYFERKKEYGLWRIVNYWRAQPIGTKFQYDEQFYEGEFDGDENPYAILEKVTDKILKRTNDTSGVEYYGFSEYFNDELGIIGYEQLRDLSKEEGYSNEMPEDMLIVYNYLDSLPIGSEFEFNISDGFREDMIKQYVKIDTNTLQDKLSQRAWTWTIHEWVIVMWDRIGFEELGLFKEAQA